MAGCVAILQTSHKHKDYMLFLFGNNNDDNIFILRLVQKYKLEKFRMEKNTK